MTEMTPEAIRDAEALVRADLREMRHRHRTTGLTPSQHYWTETAACWLVDDLMAALCEVSLARAEQARKGVGK